MNKIYKVIWSKTRNCYVAAAEFVKRNGKGASSLNSRHIAAVLATVVLCAAPVNGWANDGGIDLGTMYVGSNPDYSVQIDSDIDKNVAGHYNEHEVSGGSVTVTGGTLNGSVSGGYSRAGGVTDITDNSVTIYDGILNGTVNGGYIQDIVVLGYATENTVTIHGGTFVGNVYGGYSGCSNVYHVGEVRASGNEVIISGGMFNTHSSRIVGGYAVEATGNRVTISGGTFYNDVYGGYSYEAGSNAGASGNMVTVSKGNFVGKTYGGYAKRSDASGNSVVITGGTFGGFDVVNNGCCDSIYGGYSQNGAANGNKVVITGGTFNIRDTRMNFYESGRTEGFFGGYSDRGTVTMNTVTLGGGTFTQGAMYGGFVEYGGSVTDNAVNLTGTTKGLDKLCLFGYNNYAASHSGNELHVGGTKTYDADGNATVTKTTWQGYDSSGKHTNKVNEVANFDSIVLHNVVWGDVPALSANTMKNIGGLDVTGLKFCTHPDNSTEHEHALKDYMVLVHSESSDLSGLNISYLDEGKVKTETLTNKGINYHKAVHQSVENGITVDGSEVKRIYLADHNQSVDFFYHVVGDKITLGEVAFEKDGTARILDGRFNVTKATIDAEGLTFTGTSKLQMAAGDTMTIVDAEDAIANANGEKLPRFKTKQITNTYNFVPAEGITVAAKLLGSLEQKANSLSYTVNTNKADKLTFGSVDWKDSGALFKRPAAVIFDGATVDTTKVHFKNVHEMEANRKMTLVSDFGSSANIIGTKYKVGTTLEGEGSASLSDGDLVFTTKTAANHVQPQTHMAVMSMLAGVGLLAAGGEQAGKAVEGLGGSGIGASGAGGDENGAGANGTIIAALSGGSERYSTGSHVTTHTWNGVLGIGGKSDTGSGTFKYAAFAEHGRGNFTLRSDEGRGDGTSRYTGGGLFTRWENRHNVYVEASLRAGRLHDTANNLLHNEATGEGFGYDVHANYFGGHVGIGRIFNYRNGRKLDIYGKYFHMKRDGVSFEAEGHYDLDSVTSSVLRIGTRYGCLDKKWNWYGGLAYEYEFDGEAAGRADGAPIRAASIKGSSVRGEVGLRMDATKTNPWQVDISLIGYAGKHRGISGNVSVAYTF